MMQVVNRSGAIAASAALVAIVVGAFPVEAAAGTFDGRWVLVQRMTSSVAVPVVGDVEATTTVVSLHDLVDEDGKLRGDGKICRFEIDSGSDLVETIVPKAFRRAMPAPTIDAVLEVEDGVVKLRQPKRTVVVGAKLEDIQGEALPTKPSDPRVFDQDSDEKPGVTIRVEGLVSGDMYIVQRSWTRFDGAFLKDGSFGGRLSFANEQVVLGSTSPFLGDPPKSRPVAAKSWFRIARLSEEATCKEARSVADSYL